MNVTIAEAQSQLPLLIRAALAGDEVVITEQGQPPVRSVPLPAQREQRQPGAWADLPAAAADWDSAATNAEIARDLIGEQS